MPVKSLIYQYQFPKSKGRLEGALEECSQAESTNGQCALASNI